MLHGCVPPVLVHGVGWSGDVVLGFLCVLFVLSCVLARACACVCACCCGVLTRCARSPHHSQERPTTADAVLERPRTAAMLSQVKRELSQSGLLQALDTPPASHVRSSPSGQVAPTNETEHGPAAADIMTLEHLDDGTTHTVEHRGSGTVRSHVHHPGLHIPAVVMEAEVEDDDDDDDDDDVNDVGGGGVTTGGSGDGHDTIAQQDVRRSSVSTNRATPRSNTMPARRRSSRRSSTASDAWLIPFDDFLLDWEGVWLRHGVVLLLCCVFGGMFVHHAWWPPAAWVVACTRLLALP